MGGTWLAQLVEHAILDNPGHELKPHFGNRDYLKKKKVLNGLGITFITPEKPLRGLGQVSH